MQNNLDPDTFRCNRFWYLNTLAIHKRYEILIKDKRMNGKKLIENFSLDRFEFFFFLWELFVWLEPMKTATKVEFLGHEIIIMQIEFKCTRSRTL